MFKKPKYNKKKDNDPVSIKDLICIPVVNKRKEIIDFEFSKTLIQSKKNTVFLMAGGKGTRLLPLTKNLPKPMNGQSGGPGDISHFSEK